MSALSFEVFMWLLDIQTAHWRARYAVERATCEEYIDLGGEA